MKISVLTIFPEMFRGFEKEPVIRRAILKGAVQIEYIDVRPFAGGSFRHIDDSTFGGGAGMVLRCAPVLKALETVRESGSFTAALTPAGEKYDQPMARELAQKEHLILLCGHYEGFDQRILSRADREISIGEIFDIAGGAAATPPRRRPEAGDRLLLRLPGGKTANGVAAKVGEQPAMEILPISDK